MEKLIEDAIQEAKASFLEQRATSLGYKFSDRKSRLTELRRVLGLDEHTMTAAEKFLVEELHKRLRIALCDIILQARAVLVEPHLFGCDVLSPEDFSQESKEFLLRSWAHFNSKEREFRTKILCLPFEAIGVSGYTTQKIIDALIQEVK